MKKTRHTTALEKTKAGCEDLHEDKEVFLDSALITDCPVSDIYLFAVPSSLTAFSFIDILNFSDTLVLKGLKTTTTMIIGGAVYI